MEHTLEEITLPSLAEVFAHIPDQRKAKGMRSRLPPLLSLLSVAKFAQPDTPAAGFDLAAGALAKTSPLPCGRKK